MSVLTRTEEVFLLTIWRLKDNAYGVTIVDGLNKATGKKWRLGSIYIPLERLEKKGYLTSTLGNATSKRGGRSKRLYRLTQLGVQSLIETKELEISLWTDLSLNHLEGYCES